MQRLRTVTSLDVSVVTVAGHHAMPAVLLLLNILQFILSLFEKIQTHVLFKAGEA